MILILTYHVDPGHGWIEVHQDLVLQLGIDDKISEYSYYSFDHKLYYLEEDCDASLLIQALKDHKIEYVIRECEYKNDAFIRRMDRVGAV